MADTYATEANAGFRISGFLWNSVAKCLGRVRATIEKIVEREVLQADTNNTPTSRPVNVLDARSTLEFLDQTGHQSVGFAWSHQSRVAISNPRRTQLYQSLFFENLQRFYNSSSFNPQ